MAPSVRAQEYSSDCLNSLYDQEFKCDSAQITSYCDTSSINLSKVPSFYKDAYCEAQSNDEDDIISILADQFKGEDPTLDEDKIKSILKTGATSNIPQYNRIKDAFDREKILFESKKNLIQQFKAREMWANAKENDSPFDLILDLNMIDIILFGSQAKWVDDVYHFPKKTESAVGQTPAGGAGGGAGAEGPKAEATGETPAQPENIECVPEEGEKPPEGGPEIPPGEVPVGCGNRTVDAGEECDDGNTQSGDGCGKDCKKEPGNTLACMDPEAITFTKFVPKPASPKPAAGPSATSPIQPAQAVVAQEIPITCPPGSKPSNLPPQSINYNPILGGAPKEFPPSNKPPCPIGTTEAEVYISPVVGPGPGIVAEATAAIVEKTGELIESKTTEKAGQDIQRVTQNILKRCVPDSLCAGGEGEAKYEPVRKLLFGENYKEDPKKMELAASIEAFICVKVKKEMRPESPYPVNESCIDCSIMGMNDTLSKILEKNVAPLENNMQAWGLSNRWGPSFSFNLDVGVQEHVLNPIRDLDYGKIYRENPPPVEQTNKLAKKITQDATHNADSNQGSAAISAEAAATAQENLALEEEKLRKEQEKILQTLKAHRVILEASSVDLRYNNTVKGLLLKWQESFKRIRDLYSAVATTVKFREKAECDFD